MSKKDDNLIINTSMYEIVSRLLYSNEFENSFDRDLMNLY